MKLSVQYLVAALAIGSTGAFVLPQGSVRTNPSLDATLIENWELTQDGCVVGQTQGHPDMSDGEIISTSPLVNPQAAVPASFVSTRSGSQYLLGTPRANGVAPQVYPPPSPTAAAAEDGSITISRETFLAGGAIAAVAALTATVSTVLGNDAPPATLASTSSSAPMVAKASGPEFSKFTAGPVEPKNELLTPREVSDLFELWNQALQTGNPDAVAMRYADGAVLLPTKSDIPRSDYAGIRDYFVHFLEKKPSGKILESYSKYSHYDHCTPSFFVLMEWIDVGTNTDTLFLFLPLIVSTSPGSAMDVGIYEFSFENGMRIRARYSFLYKLVDGQWKIKHHHSSGMPETPGQVISESEVRGLFDLWNDALLTGDSDAVTRRYAKGAVLLPTVSDVPRTTYAGIKDYFDHFLELKPSGKIVESYVSIGENWCKDVGIYEFTKGTDGTVVRARYSYVYVFEDGEWKISHHHSSLMPEELLAKANKK